MQPGQETVRAHLPSGSPSLHFIRVAAISQNTRRDFQGLIITLRYPLSSAASTTCATAGLGRAAGVFVCVPAPAGSRLQRAQEAYAGQQGANVLLSQHALIRGTDTLLIISSSCQPVFAPALFPSCLPGVSNRQGDLVLCFLLIKVFPSLLTARQLVSLLPSSLCLSCLSVSGGLGGLLSWRHPVGVRAVLPPSALPGAQTWCAACGHSLLLNPTLLLLLKVAIEERFAGEAFMFLRLYNCGAVRGRRDIFEHISLCLGVKQKH